MGTWSWLRAGVLFAWIFALPALAFEELIVGRGGLGWGEAAEEVALIDVAPDSVWLWPADPRENLAPTALGRGGRIFGLFTPEGDPEAAPQLIEVPQLAFMIDGDQSTAFNPDEQGLPRQMPIFIDLGAPFRIDGLRFFPRLDSDHRQLFMQTFDLSINDGSAPQIFAINLTALSYSTLLRSSISRPNNEVIVQWPRTIDFSDVRQTRYVQLRALENLPWEIAELEIDAEGSVPTGEYISRPLPGRGGNPVWGRVRNRAGDLDDLPIVLQTRSGADEEPLLYFMRVGGEEGELQQIDRTVWESLADGAGQLGAVEQGPVVPNPVWSTWEGVEDGIVRSPSPNRFIQFRLRLLEPGTRLEQLIFEYTTQPLAHRLEAEISPTVVAAAQETPFVLSIVVEHVDSNDESDTGFRFIEVLSSAGIVAVDSVLIDDEHAVYTAEIDPDAGFTVNMWRRIARDGLFVQVFFRAQIFVDGTAFQVRALDRRSTAGSEETVYQFARTGDVDPFSVGASLAVRLDQLDGNLVGSLRPRNSLFTPDGDGINDVFEVEFNLLKLTRTARMAFQIRDLSGHLLRQGQVESSSGHFVRLWDGRTDGGQLVPPGMYLYRVEVEADEGTAARQGVVGVAY
ncbi:MAG: hypothetical protein GKR89_05650 [Candidatus Latescibacteria bacterium]|nr:hypothetical protein [Candidatus Latescibacterota bacterium]